MSTKQKITTYLWFAKEAETQEEVDKLWSRLSAGGEESSVAGWKDKYGLSWQIVPAAPFRLMQNPDPARSKRVMEAMLKMRKIDVAGLERACNQK